MARSNKPVIWLPFAAGGTLAAFLLPAIVLFTLLVSIGVLPPESIDFQRIYAWLVHPLGKVMTLAILGLFVWHTAHRLRMTVQDLGIRSPVARQWVARLCYLGAAIATILLVHSLWILS